MSGCGYCYIKYVRHSFIIDLNLHLGYCPDEHILETKLNISLKTKVKYWFWFLRLAHTSTDSRVITAIKESASFYEPWGDYLHGSFNAWWKGHASLFKQPSSLTRMSAGDIACSDDCLYFRVPLTYAPTTAAKIIERMYREEFEKRRVRTSKVKKVYGGEYRLSADDFQVSQFDYYHRFTRDVYLPLVSGSTKAKVKDFIDLAISTFARQKLKSSLEFARRKVPFSDADTDTENLKRQVRRYRAISENLLLNVAQGKFPGDYTP